jgi:toxin secretion/phage lysis holin
MKEIWNMIQLAFVAIGGWFGWFLGGFDGFLYALVVFMAIDYLTGLMAAVVEKQLCSEVGFRGIFKKVLIFLFVGIGSVIDKQIIGEGSVLRTAVIFFYISNEGSASWKTRSESGFPFRRS